MKTEQTIFRLRPPGYTGDSLKDFKELLSNGWHVKFITMVENSREKFTHDYILERTIEAPAKDGMKEGR